MRATPRSMNIVDYGIRTMIFEKIRKFVRLKNNHWNCTVVFEFSHNDLEHFLCHLHQLRERDTRNPQGNILFLLRHGVNVRTRADVIRQQIVRFALPQYLDVLRCSLMFLDILQSSFSMFLGTIRCSSMFFTNLRRSSMFFVTFYWYERDVHAHTQNQVF